MRKTLYAGGFVPAIRTISEVIGSRSMKVQVYRDYMHHNHTEHYQVATVIHRSIFGIEMLAFMCK